MRKEDHINSSAGIVKALEKAGIEGTPVTIIFDPEIKKEVRNYVMGIEKAHKKAAKSKLHFGVSLASCLRL